MLVILCLLVHIIAFFPVQFVNSFVSITLSRHKDSHIDIILESGVIHSKLDSETGLGRLGFIKCLFITKIVYADEE